MLLIFCCYLKDYLSVIIGKSEINPRLNPYGLMAFFLVVIRRFLNQSVCRCFAEKRSADVITVASKYYFAINKPLGFLSVVIPYTVN